MDLPSLPTTSLGTSGGGSGEGEGSKHRFVIERIPESDAVLVRRDNGPSYTIPMRLLAGGKTISEIYEELINA